MSWELFKKNEAEQEAKTKLSPPWIAHARKIYALFGKDPDVEMSYDPDKPEVKLYVSNPEKAEAISRILPTTEQFGGVTLQITVLSRSNENRAAIFAKAFKGNPVFSEVVNAEDALGNPMAYVVFKNKVVQYFDDDLGDANGVKSTLYEQIAVGVLAPFDGIFYSTEVDEDAKIVWPKE